MITVLDKGPSLWSGCLNNGKVGVFSPSSTVTYIGTLPSQGNHSRWQNEDNYHTFQRSSLRGSKGKRKISRDMISGPRGDLQHTGHVGPDGAFFGDVGGFARTWNNKSVGQESIKSRKDLCRADSDVSERAPLIDVGHKKSNGEEKNSQNVNNASQVQGANKNPRMGYAIGYLRKSSNANTEGVPVTRNATISGPIITSSTVSHPHKQHEYQSISDEELGGPPDLGLSLMDEVFSELKSKSQEAEKKNVEEVQNEENEEDEEEEEKLVRKLDAKKLGQSMKDVRDLVSSTLTLTSRRQSKKKQATVKPIKVS